MKPDNKPFAGSGKVTVAVTVQVDRLLPEEGGSGITLSNETVARSVAEAIENAIRFSSYEGHRHPLEDDISILYPTVAATDLTPETK